MAFNLRNVVVGLAAGAALALSGCGSSFDCSKAPCPNDPAPTADQVTACNNAINDATCGSKAKDASSCEQSNIKCGSDGKTDPSSLSTAASACAAQITAYTTCLSGGSSSSGSTAGSGSGSGGSTGA